MSNALKLMKIMTLTMTGKLAI